MSDLITTDALANNDSDVDALACLISLRGGELQASSSAMSHLRKLILVHFSKSLMTVEGEGVR